MKLLSFIKFLAFLWGCFSIYWYVCHLRNNCCFFCELTTEPLVIADKPYGANILTTTTHIQYEHAKAIPQLTKEQENGLIQTAYYLRNHPYRGLEIRGYYGDKEPNMTTFDNLGLARADTIRQFLYHLGVPEAQVSTKGVAKKNVHFYRNYLVQGNGFKFLKIEVVPEQISKKLLQDTIRIRFNSAKGGEFVFSKTTHDYLEQVKGYLAQEHTANILIIGHTDKRGSPEENLKLGRERAESIQHHLEQLGIKSHQIQIDSKGENQPIKIGDPTQNRRVELIVRNRTNS